MEYFCSHSGDNSQNTVTDAALVLLSASAAAAVCFLPIVVGVALYAVFCALFATLPMTHTLKRACIVSALVMMPAIAVAIAFTDVLPLISAVAAMLAGFATAYCTARGLPRVYHVSCILVVFAVFAAICFILTLYGLYSEIGLDAVDKLFSQISAQFDAYFDYAAKSISEIYSGYDIGEIRALFDAALVQLRLRAIGIVLCALALIAYIVTAVYRRFVILFVSSQMAVARKWSLVTSGASGVIYIISSLVGYFVVSGYERVSDVSTFGRIFMVALTNIAIVLAAYMFPQGIRRISDTLSNVRKANRALYTVAIAAIIVFSVINIFTVVLLITYIGAFSTRKIKIVTPRDGDKHD